jgi:hypothetical protein
LGYPTYPFSELKPVAGRFGNIIPGMFTADAGEGRNPNG